MFYYRMFMWGCILAIFAVILWPTNSEALVTIKADHPIVEKRANRWLQSVSNRVWEPDMTLTMVDDIGFCPSRPRACYFDGKIYLSYKDFLESDLFSAEELILHETAHGIDEYFLSESARNKFLDLAQIHESWDAPRVSLDAYYEEGPPLEKYAVAWSLCAINIILQHRYEFDYKFTTGPKALRKICQLFKNNY